MLLQDLQVRHDVLTLRIDNETVHEIISDSDFRFRFPISDSDSDSVPRVKCARTAQELN